MCIMHFVFGISTRVPLVQSKKLVISHQEQICMTQLKINCLYSWHELPLSKQTFSHIQQIIGTSVAPCLMACEPPYHELLPTNIVCCVVVIFKVTILLFHMCMLLAFEYPQIFKLVFIEKVMCLSNNTIWIFWFNYSLECLPTSWVEDYVSIPTVDD